MTNQCSPGEEDTPNSVPRATYSRGVGVGGSQPRWPEPTSCSVSFLGPERRLARRRSGKAETGSHRPSRPARGLAAPHLRTPSGNAAASSPTRAASAAGCSRTCRLALPGDVEGRRGPQNRVAAQLPERRGAVSRRPPSRPFRRRRRRPRGPRAWPRPASVGHGTRHRPSVRMTLPPPARGRHNIARHAHWGRGPVTECADHRSPSNLNWAGRELLESPPRPLSSSSLWMRILRPRLGIQKA